MECLSLSLCRHKEELQTFKNALFLVFFAHPVYVEWMKKNLVVAC